MPILQLFSPILLDYYRCIIGIIFPFGIVSFIGSKIVHYENFSIELIAYHCDFVSASFHLTDHDEIAFVKPTELRNYKMAPADVFIVERLTSVRKDL